LLAAQPAPVPFNYPPLFFGRIEEPGNQEQQEAKQNIAALVNTYPVPVPFNYPQPLTRSAGVVKK
jgi:hypothetical protein